MRLGSILLLVLLLALPGSALARTNPKFNALVKQAERLYESGQYKDSAEKLIEAYVYAPHPRLIYNIARAYDQAGELELSLEYYQRYVNSKEGTDPTLLKRSALSIDRLKELVKQREQTRRREAEEQARLEAEKQQAQAQAAQEAEAKRRAEEELRFRTEAAIREREASRRTAKIAAFALGGVAVAGLGGGTVFGIQANGSKERFRGAETIADKQSFEARTKQQALIADLGFGLGVAAAVAAVIVYPKGPDAPKTSTEVITFLAGPGSAGIEVKF